MVCSPLVEEDEAEAVDDPSATEAAGKPGNWARAALAKSINVAFGREAVGTLAALGAEEGAS